MTTEKKIWGKKSDEAGDHRAASVGVLCMSGISRGEMTGFDLLGCSRKILRSGIIHPLFPRGND